MKANELRLGNWVMWSNAEFQIISPIMMQRTYQKIKEGRVNSIRISPEWLERMDGVKDGLWHKIDLGNNIGYITINPSNGVVWLKHERNEHTSLNPQSIFYVHQLQNLYFALTGQELTIKELA